MSRYVSQLDVDWDNGVSAVKWRPGIEAWIERNLKGAWTSSGVILRSGQETGAYNFELKEDAALFKLFWGASHG